jgi:hypothetical protein
MGRPETDANRPLEEDEFFPARTPADVDREHFREAPSVRFWNAWRHDDSKSPAASVADILAQISAATKSPADAAYWAYHVFRSSWFLGQGAAGMLVSSVAGAGPDAAPTLSRARAGAAAAERLVSEAVQVYKQDLKRVNDGTHRAPYDMDPRHRQFNPAFVADKSLRFASEARSTLRKHAAATKQRASPESGREATEAADAVPGTRVWLSSPLYPDYYLNTFHWQTDGWLSKESAKVYEVSTETLFVGRQDAMQRTALAPLREWFDETQQSATGENVKLLEMACGTGRFLTFTRDTYPQIDAVGLDLVAVLPRRGAGKRAVLGTVHSGCDLVEVREERGKRKNAKAGRLARDGSAASSGEPGESRGRPYAAAARRVARGGGDFFRGGG